MSDPVLPSASRLRLAVAAFRSAERRLVCPPCLHVGLMGHTDGLGTFVEERAEPLDADLRREVAAALVSRALTFTEAPELWLTRGGHLSTHDIDLVWLSAATAAAAEAGLATAFVVITRRGWYDPRTLQHREWARLRVA